ncbi:hypothetical protein AMTR_s00064p00210050 [Amborella trichopoda]|uniref:Aminotransferase class V domain-containing protein n=1 Tax=Amborella trichopoda TaxID=13333 RepID=U5DBE3_AMBTC|nr:hypothetical protein AMTR_s00064p00210050 [Amborella trichopoda]
MRIFQDKRWVQSSFLVEGEEEAAISSLTTPHSLLQKRTNYLNSRSSYSFNGCSSAKTQKPLSITYTTISPSSLSTPLELSKPHEKERVFNFVARPTTLPPYVLKKAQSEFYIWGNLGMSVMEMNNRGKDFLSISQKAESDIRELLIIPENYEVLFLQGSATSQFCAILLNLCKPSDRGAKAL